MFTELTFETFVDTQLTPHAAAAVWQQAMEYDEAVEIVLELRAEGLSGWCAQYPRLPKALADIETVVAAINDGVAVANVTNIKCLTPVDDCPF